MSLLEKINSDYIVALKQGDGLKVSVLRLLKSVLTNAKIANSNELSEEMEMAVIKRQAKQNEEAISLYQNNGQGDRAVKEKMELEIIKSYLPEEISDVELNNIISETFAKFDKFSATDFGKIMGSAMSEIKGRASGERVGNIVRQKLNL